MPYKIRTFSDQRQHTQRVDLDGTTYRLTFTWRARVQGWYLDIYTRSGEPVAVGLRINPRWSPTSAASDERLPEGLLVVRGYDGYKREDLGDELEVDYITLEELLSVPPPDDEEPEVIL